MHPGQEDQYIDWMVLTAAGMAVVGMAAGMVVGTAVGDGTGCSYHE